ncbi:MAG: LysM peptidoglycan-binding domain-containing protein [Bacilli bacterium]|nr:LysM peptidoglycan-binding domain-containing protein [Bacilli bacterium]
MYNTNNPTYTEYVVKKGDSLYTIAKKYKTTIAELTDVNMLTTNTLYPNQVLLVPTNSNFNGLTEYVTLDNDTFEKLSKRFNVDIETLGAYNDFGKIVLKEGQIIYLPSDNARSYVVSSDDTISSIISKTGKSAEELLELNISPNMRLKI